MLKDSLRQEEFDLAALWLEILSFCLSAEKMSLKIFLVLFVCFTCDFELFLSREACRSWASLAFSDTATLSQDVGMNFIA
jgi:hypothetical protein